MEFTSSHMVAGFEGFRDHAYKDSGGRFTIGFGHTKDVTPFQVCTWQQALDWLREDTAWAGTLVNHVIDGAGVKVSQGVFDAMVDFTFNVGSRRFINSIFLRCVLKGDLEGACADLLHYNHDAKGTALLGLTRRRKAEINLIDPTYLKRHGLQ